MESAETRPLAVVTGASSGIGRELAVQFAENGFDLIVAAEDERIHAAAVNAGAGAGGDFARDNDLADELRLIALNVTGAVQLAKRAAGDDRGRPRGRAVHLLDRRDRARPLSRDQAAVGLHRAQGRRFRVLRPDAGGGRGGVEVPGDDSVTGLAGDEFLNGGADGLELPFVLVVELPVGEVVDQPDTVQRCGGEDVGDQAGAGEIGGAAGDVDVQPDDLADRRAVPGGGWSSPRVFPMC
jgi:hypothetical protein